MILPKEIIRIFHCSSISPLEIPSTNRQGRHEINISQRRYTARVLILTAGLRSLRMRWKIPTSRSTERLHIRVHVILNELCCIATHVSLLQCISRSSSSRNIEGVYRKLYYQLSYIFPRENNTLNMRKRDEEFRSQLSHHNVQYFYIFYVTPCILAFISFVSTFSFLLSFYR